MNRLQLNHFIQTVVRPLDIGYNPAPEAIFDPLIQGFNIWCTPPDHPGGDWLKVTQHMIPGAFTKPCEFVATVFAEWDDEVEYIIGMNLSTSAYALEDHLPDKYSSSNHLIRRGCKSIYNLPADLAWAKAKIAWIFARANIPCPQITVKEE